MLLQSRRAALPSSTRKDIPCETLRAGEFIAYVVVEQTGFIVLVSLLLVLACELYSDDTLILCPLVIDPAT